MCDVDNGSALRVTSAAVGGLATDYSVRAIRCQVGELVEDHGTAIVVPAIGSSTTCGRSSPRVPLGVPRIAESSGAHSQAEQHSPLMVPG